jgi:hypothetical protein
MIAMQRIETTLARFPLAAAALYAVLVLGASSWGRGSANTEPHWL